MCRRITLRVVKGALLVGGLGVALATTGMARPVQAAAGPGTTMVRLHVIANSNSSKDQAVKLLVRDHLLAYMAPALEGSPSARATMAWLKAHLPEIKVLANETLHSEGLPYGAQVFLGWTEFPAKNLGALTFPQGKYEALTVSLGKAAGQNWWCVVFPSLCFVDSAPTLGAGEGASGPETILTVAQGKGRLHGPPVRITLYFPSELSKLLKDVESWHLRL